MRPIGTAFVVYAVAPSRDGSTYQLRRTHRVQRDGFAQLVRIELMEDEFPMNAKGRKEAAELVAMLNAGSVDRRAA